MKRRPERISFMENPFEPRPCPVCGNKEIHTIFVGGGYEGALPFWCRMQCAKCGHNSAKKLFRSRAILAWNGIKNLEKGCALITALILLLLFSVRGTL